MYNKNIIIKNLKIQNIEQPQLRGRSADSADYALRTTDYGLEEDSRRVTDTIQRLDPDYPDCLSLRL